MEKIKIHRVLIVRDTIVIREPKASSFEIFSNSLYYKLVFLLCFFMFILINKTYCQSTVDEWIAPKTADALINPIGGLRIPPVAKQLFVSNCAPCHGDKGKGDGPVGMSLTPKPYNLTKSKVENETDGSLFWRITNGHQTMPTFQNTLSAMERWQLVNYIRSLQADAIELEKPKSKK
ncbi:MAG TPA: cytochrome c [Bacteroidia bacterium]|jgi:hypothetical protein|nr:cytochrome c [Bacteroidia bacterium]